MLERSWAISSDKAVATLRPATRLTEVDLMTEPCTQAVISYIEHILQRPDDGPGGEVVLAVRSTLGTQFGRDAPFDPFVESFV